MDSKEVGKKNGANQGKGGLNSKARLNSIKNKKALIC